MSVVRSLEAEPMPRHAATNAARKIVHEASASSTELLVELAEPLSEYLLEDYAQDDWQNRPLIETLARVGPFWKLSGSTIPPPLLAVLRKASEAGQPIGVA
jgi:hypothetical protein